MSILSKPYFHDEAAAFAHVESKLWPNGPTCPHCGALDRIYALEGVKDKKGRVRPGLKKCGHCRKQFTVRVGTVFESSHIPLTKWLQVIYMMTCSKKGVSAHQLHRVLEINYKAAWFAAHRIREAMRDGSLAPMGGDGKVVEADETYFGKQENPQPSPQRKGRPYTKRRGPAGKRAVLALVERGGHVRSFHVERADKETVSRVVTENIVREAVLHTDESRLYGGAEAFFAAHEAVKHSAGEYVRGDVHTNTVENVFSVFKRGMHGVYQHCSEKHLHRYLAEFDFRYNNRSALGVEDQERAERALTGISGKRLTYRPTSDA